MVYSLTLFKSIYDKYTDKQMSFTNWNEFEHLLYGLSAIKRKSKKDAQLISPAIYLEDTTRANKNVISWAGWAALDVDDHVLNENNFRDELLAKYGSYYFVCYSTASSTIDKPKFRIVFPLAYAVVAENIRHFWHALNSEFGEMGDKQVKDFSRMYYIPGDYENANNFIFTNSGGNFIVPSELMAKHSFVTKQMTGTSFIDRLPESMQHEIISYRKEQLAKNNTKKFNWSGYRDCPFVSRKLVEEYKGISETGWYRTMYRLMVSIAANAITKGYPITAHEISALCSELDIETGNWYESRPLVVEADRALEFVYKNR